MNVHTRVKVEQQIVAQVVKDLLAANFTLHIEDEDDEPHAITDPADDELFACDECRLFVDNGGAPSGWVYFVYGNDGWDVVSDYTTNLEAVLKGSGELAERLEAEYS